MNKYFLSLLFVLLPLYGIVSHTMINYHRCPGALEENRTPIVFGFIHACAQLDVAFKGVSTSVHKNRDITVCIMMEGCHATIFIENDSGDCLIDFFSRNEKADTEKFKKFFDEYLHAQSVNNLKIIRDRAFSFSA